MSQYGELRKTVDCSGDPVLTKQSEAAACDINGIMARYEKSGLLEHLKANEGFYLDVSNVPDYQSAFAIVRSAETLFGSMPAELRAKFQNDPGVYLSFVSDPANKEELIKLGILENPQAKAIADAAAQEAEINRAVEIQTQVDLKRAAIAASAVKK